MGLEYYTSRGLEPYVNPKTGKVDIREITTPGTDEWSAPTSTPEQAEQMAYVRGHTPAEVQQKQIEEQRVRNKAMGAANIKSQSELIREQQARVVSQRNAIAQYNKKIGTGGIGTPNRQEPGGDTYYGFGDRYFIPSIGINDESYIPRGKKGEVAAWKIKENKYTGVSNIEYSYYNRNELTDDLLKTIDSGVFNSKKKLTEIEFYDFLNPKTPKTQKQTAPVSIYEQITGNKPPSSSESPVYWKTKETPTDDTTSNFLTTIYTSPLQKQTAPVKPLIYGQQIIGAPTVDKTTNGNIIQDNAGYTYNVQTGYNPLTNEYTLTPPPVVDKSILGQVDSAFGEADRDFWAGIAGVANVVTGKGISPNENWDITPKSIQSGANSQIGTFVDTLFGNSSDEKYTFGKETVKGFLQTPVNKPWETLVAVGAGVATAGFVDMVLGVPAVASVAATPILGGTTTVGGSVNIGSGALFLGSTAYDTATSPTPAKTLGQDLMFGAAFMGGSSLYPKGSAEYVLSRSDKAIGKFTAKMGMDTSAFLGGGKGNINLNPTVFYGQRLLMKEPVVKTTPYEVPTGYKIRQSTVEPQFKNRFEAIAYGMKEDVTLESFVNRPKIKLAMAVKEKPIPRSETGLWDGVGKQITYNDFINRPKLKQAMSIRETPTPRSEYSIVQKVKATQPKYNGNMAMVGTQAVVMPAIMGVKQKQSAKLKLNNINSSQNMRNITGINTLDTKQSTTNTILGTIQPTVTTVRTRQTQKQTQIQGLKAIQSQPLTGISQGLKTNQRLNQVLLQKQSNKPPQIPLSVRFNFKPQPMKLKTPKNENPFGVKLSSKSRAFKFNEKVPTWLGVEVIGGTKRKPKSTKRGRKK